MERQKTDREIAFEMLLYASMTDEQRAKYEAKKLNVKEIGLFCPELLQELLEYSPKPHVYGSKGWDYELELLRNRLHRNIDTWQFTELCLDATRDDMRVFKETGNLIFRGKDGFDHLFDPEVKSPFPEIFNWIIE